MNYFNPLTVLVDASSLTYWSCGRVCAAGGWLAVLLCLLCFTPSAQPLGRPSAPAAAAAVAGAGAAKCSLPILGGEGSIRHAGMRCTSPQPTIALSSPHLAAYKSNFTGVNITSSCGASRVCLVTVCGGALVLRHSSVSWVRGLPLEAVVCVAGSSRLEVHESRFNENHARALGVLQQARVLLNASTISGNVVNGSGGGVHVLIMGGAVVTITGGSRVSGNNATDDGGGLAVEDNATLRVDRNSRNTAAV